MQDSLEDDRGVFSPNTFVVYVFCVDCTAGLNDDAKESESVAANNVTNLLADVGGLEGDLLDMESQPSSAQMQALSISSRSAPATSLLDD